LQQKIMYLQSRRARAVETPTAPRGAVVRKLDSKRAGKPAQVNEPGK
jgi:hypothetical protein